MEAAPLKTSTDYTLKIEAEGTSEISVDYNMMMEEVDPSETLANFTCRRSFSLGIEKRML
jgi:hypothetical protein